MWENYFYLLPALRLILFTHFLSPRSKLFEIILDCQQFYKMTTKPEEIKQEKELDCSNASRGVWLVKVPKYIAKKWEKSKAIS